MAFPRKVIIDPKKFISVTVNFTKGNGQIDIELDTLGVQPNPKPNDMVRTRTMKLGSGAVLIKKSEILRITSHVMDIAGPPAIKYVWSGLVGASDSNPGPSDPATDVVDDQFYFAQS